MNNNNPIRGVIVIEGCDGTGKTTLANALVDSFGAHYIHLSYHEGVEAMWAVQLQALTIAQAKMHHQLVVIDRHWASENVYGAVFRNSTAMADHAKIMDGYFRKLKAINILCLLSSPERNEELHRRNREKREEMYSSILGVAERYHALWHGHDFNGGAASPRWNDYVNELSIVGIKNSNRMVDWVRHNFESTSVESTIYTAFKKLHLWSRI